MRRAILALLCIALGACQTMARNEAALEREQRLRSQQNTNWPPQMPR